MFVRVKKIGAYEYLYLVENAREGGRHVQRVVKALGRRDEVEASGMLDALVASAARHSRRSIVLSSFYGGELAELRRVSIGPDLVFGRLWRETGCAEVISALLVGRRFGFDIERAIYLTVLHRLMVSGSDRHASRWHHGFRIPGAEELTLDHAYRAMTWLGEEIADGRTTTDAIEEDLYRHRQELFGEVSIAFFDTTSLYFEGAGGQTLGQLGHSKDYRAHLKQVVLGMVLDGDDRPFASFLWPGNTADVTRLMPVVQRLRERFGIAQVCIVADRGMISAATLAALEKAGLEYILGVRERSTKEVRNEVIEDDGVAVPLVIPRQKGETQLAIKETTLKGRRYVLCRNEEEARKDADRRAAILAGLDRKLTHGDKALVSNKGFRRFVKYRIRQLLHRLRQGRGGCKVRRAVRPAHQHQVVGSTGRPALSELAGCGGHVQNHQGAADHAADLPQNRCGHPRSHLLQLPCRVAEEGVVRPPRRSPSRQSRMAAHRR